MEPAYEIVSFDCYGTLVDWETGISRAFIDEAAQDGVHLERADVLAAHREIEPLVQAEAFRSYRDVLTETARRMALRFGWAIDHTRAGFLAAGLADWPIFADTNPALRRLRESGYRLGILSNVDDDLLCATLRGIDVGIELVVSAQQVRSYKPADAHFVRARQAIGEAAWLHAAQSWFHDIVPATRLAVDSAWINRNADARGADGSPKFECGDLAGLAERLC